MSEWTVRINGVDRVNVKPGDCVEIGRKPLRPLADDGMQRLDVVDQTKSMSKRHAVFEVKQNGSAAVRDLGSTNGSYVVRDNGDLLRLPVDAEFMLPSSPMRMQFGDVPADFIRIDDVEHEQQLPVPDLFGYAVNEAPQEPDAADMSVDDILDLRAGEPTAAFSAASVRHKVDELDFSSLNIAQSVVKAEEPATPRDLFADAMAEQSEDTVPDGEAQQTQPTADFVPQTSPQAEPVEPAEPSAPAVVPVDAIAHPVAKVPETVSGTASETATETESETAPSAEAVSIPDQQPDVQAQPEQSPVFEQPGQFVQPDQSDQSDQPVRSDQSERHAAAEQPVQVSVADLGEADTTGVYTPAFEPGSVFDRVSKGELKAQEPVVEVDGLTSDDAKTTQDFSTQFEIARHPELLAFLAMNPYLYDDMYAWLAARGEADIDEALSHNKGYQEYREAVGK